MYQLTSIQPQYINILTVISTSFFLHVCDQQEALSRIISTLANKCEELQHFLESVNKTLTGLQVSS